MIICVQLLGGTAPLKLGRAKNVRNSVRFWTILHFYREYLQNESNFLIISIFPICQRFRYIFNTYCSVFRIATA